MQNEIHCEMSHDYQDGILDPSAYEFGNVGTCAEELWVEIDHDGFVDPLFALRITRWPP